VLTIITGDQAAFVRILSRPRSDAALARSTIERLLDLIGGHPDLNEVKHTSVPL
jgi:hypothetical protein